MLRLGANWPMPKVRRLVLIGNLRTSVEFRKELASCKDGRVARLQEQSGVGRRSTFRTEQKKPLVESGENGRKQRLPLVSYPCSGSDTSAAEKTWRQPHLWPRTIGQRIPCFRLPHHWRVHRVAVSTHSVLLRDLRPIPDH